MEPVRALGEATNNNIVLRQSEHESIVPAHARSEPPGRLDRRQSEGDVHIILYCNMNVL